MLTVVLLSVNLIFVMGTFRSGNQELEKYTAGMEAVGRGHRLFVVQDDVRASPLVDPILHAADYYCQGRDNVNLDNYEASTPHFPVKYRRGVTRGRDHWAVYSNQEAVDVILCWAITPSASACAPAGWEEVFCQGRLRIYRRPLRP